MLFSRLFVLFSERALKISKYALELKLIFQWGANHFQSYRYLKANLLVEETAYLSFLYAIHIVYAAKARSHRLELYHLSIKAAFKVNLTINE